MGQVGLAGLGVQDLALPPGGQVPVGGGDIAAGVVGDDQLPVVVGVLAGAVGQDLDDLLDLADRQQVPAGLALVELDALVQLHGRLTSLPSLTVRRRSSRRRARSTSSWAPRLPSQPGMANRASQSSR